MPTVSENEILILKKQVAAQRDNIITAAATMQEVERNIHNCAEELKTLGVEIGQVPAAGAPKQEWEAFYTAVSNRTTEMLEKMNEQITTSVESIRSKVNSWR